MAPAAPVFSLRALATAAMLAASLSSAHAAIFEDGEARRAIVLGLRNFERVNLDLLYALPGQALAQAEAAALVVDTSLLAASKDFGSPDQGQVAAHAMDQFVILGDVAAPEVTVKPILGEGATYPCAAER